MHLDDADLLSRPLRASPRRRLILYDRLPPADKEALAGLAADPRFYGVLRARPGDGPAAAGPPMAVDRDTALLWLTLAEPAPLPAYARRQLGAAAARTVARLIADGVLEIADGDAFISGSAALRGEGTVAAAGRVAALSLAAVRHGEALAATAMDPITLARRLYGHHGEPLTPAWSRRLPDTAAVERHLGLGAGAALARSIDRAFVRQAHPGWLSYRARTAAAVAGMGGSTWKLYVSPRAEALAEVLWPLADVLAVPARGALGWKVGASAAGLLRPDKLVAYFASFEHLAAAAERLAAALDGVPAQGVPFTAEIAGAGLLSWGVDPPDDVCTGGGRRESWRLWVVQRLAVALCAARDAGADGGPPPWQRAVARVGLEGIDTATWTPGAGLWKVDDT